ncbi:hypothetical protein K1719_045824 [Acacia pycnantha]|nr:hypothetical protein K1719_045824 [Acacia pycnantha]
MCIVVFRWQAHQLYPLILFNNRDKCELPLLFLKSKSIPREFGEDLKTEAENYNGFNLVVGDIESKSMVYMSNRGKKHKVLYFSGVIIVLSKRMCVKPESLLI